MALCGDDGYENTKKLEPARQWYWPGRAGQAGEALPNALKIVRIVRMTMRPSRSPLSLSTT